MPILIKPLGTPKVETKPSWAPQWVDDYLLVFRLPCGIIHLCKGSRYGPFYIHPSLPGEFPRAVLTHLKSRLAIARLIEPADAIAMAEKLWELNGNVWLEDEVSAEMVGEKVVYWIRRCMATLKMVEGI